MSNRTKIAILAVIVTVAVTAAVVSVLLTRKSQQEAITNAPPVATREDLGVVTAAPHLIFESTAPGPNYGFVAAVPLSDPDGPRAFTPAACERVYARAQGAVCLQATRAVVTTYRVLVLDASWNTVSSQSLAGLPSRARMSPDGSLIATTTFVFGDSYANPGQFSTRTVITRVDGTLIGDLEQFTLRVDGSVNNAADRNIWGVTFVDDDTFYATAASGSTTWLVKGDVAARTLTSIRTDVECPSLSPDGTRIAFKKHGDLPRGQWRLAVYDLRSEQETVLAETRSVDDQVEWLDNDNVLYGLSRNEPGTATTDIWSVPADGSGEPAVLVHDAWSPAVVI